MHPWKTPIPFLLLIVTCLHATAAEPTPSHDPAETGYFDGRLWRIGLSNNGRSALALDDAGRLYVSGRDLGAVAWDFPEMARWDGRRWETLVTNGGPIEILVPLAGQLFAGGGFTQINGEPRMGVARLDGTQWHPLGDGIGMRPLSVRCMAGFGGSLYVGGSFTNAGSLAVTNIARWDLATETWHPMGDELAGPLVVTALAASGADVFAASGDRVLRWNGSGWESLGTFGSNGITPPQIVALRWHEDALYAAGAFGSVNGRELAVVARWRDGQWESVTTDPITGSCTAVDFSDGRLVLTGTLQLPNQPLPNSANVVTLNDSQWRSELGPGARSPAYALTCRGREMFLISAPTLRAAQFDNTPVLWHWDGTEWSPISGGISPYLTSRWVARTAQGVVFPGLTTSSAMTHPMFHDGWAFRQTTGASHPELGTLQIVRTLPRIGEIACLPAVWSQVLTATVLSRLNGLQWEAATPATPLTRITHLADTGKRIAIAGPGSSALSEVWIWEGREGQSSWQKAGELSDPTAGAGRIHALEWHGNTLAVGCDAVRIGGILRSNLVVWNGASWSSPASLPLPVRILSSAPGRLYLGLYSGINHSIWTWDGSAAVPLGMVPLQELEDLSVSDDGVVAAVGRPRLPGTVPLWFWRGDHWEPPAGWTSTDPNAITGCVWLGNDLHLAGQRATYSEVESLGLGIWHEPGLRVIAQPESSPPLRLRATGTVPAHFAWEHSPDLNIWTAFATNALGNPGWLEAPERDGDVGFLRVRPLP
ncbi:MAG: hypothetical protein J0L84_11475 [Verrucomicrobia bacterium]|nr:hypothetical protein [Verrucomicrobiota bacterium]